MVLLFLALFIKRISNITYVGGDIIDGIPNHCWQGGPGNDTHVSVEVKDRVEL
jgi:hypothetical protein